MFEATVGEYEDRVVIGTYETDAQAYQALGIWLTENPQASSPYAKVTEIEHPIEGDVRAIVAEMRRKPDPQVLIEWIDMHLTASLDPVFAGFARAIGAYFNAVEDAEND